MTFTDGGLDRVPVVRLVNLLAGNALRRGRKTSPQRVWQCKAWLDLPPA